MSASRLIRMLCMAMLVMLLLPQTIDAAKAEPTKEKIIFIPHDSRPISSKQTADVVQRVGYDVVVPPQELLGNREDWGHPDELWTWLDTALAQPGVKAAVISSDAMIYGSLVGSRKHAYTRSQVLARAQRFDGLQRTCPKVPLYVFGSIMRTPLRCGYFPLHGSAGQRGDRGAHAP